MKLFKCGHCGQPVYFENYFCVHCNAALGFDPVTMEMLSLEANATDATGYESTETAAQYKYCVNKQLNTCNWLLPQNSTETFCIACKLNHTIPDLSEPSHWDKWYRIEVAKHRLVYALLRFKLPVASKADEPETGIAFDFMAEQKESGERLLTGHDNGLITLNINEADDALREMARNQMDEVYRTLLGHFRHEIGHYYWDRLIKDTDRLIPFRKLFGDDSIDYGEALKAHYNKSASEDWRENFISAYAAAHPWEDWAETWAHYLHIIDTLETAYSFGLSVKPKAADSDNDMSANINIDPYGTKNFSAVIDRWIPLSFVMNSLNRSMGMKDPYPFVITGPVKEKLQFIHETIRGKR